MTWSRSRRIVIGTGGFALGALALTLGLIAMAQGAQIEHAGGLAIVVEWSVAFGGIYLVAAGLWGGWMPGTRRACIQSVRALSSWGGAPECAILSRPSTHLACDYDTL